MTTAAPSTRWWRDRRARNRVAVGAFAALALTGMLFVAFTNYLFAGDRRVLVVTMQQGATQEDRETIKQLCGDLPAVTVVADRGDPDPRLQSRFAVRFGIQDATDPQLAALQTCLNTRQDIVRGFLVDDTGRD